MDNKDFDRLLREKFSNETLKERADGWQQLSERLGGAQKRRPMFLVLRVAAALLFLVGLSSGILFLWNRQEPKPTNLPTVVSNSSTNEVKLKEDNPVQSKKEKSKAQINKQQLLQHEEGEEKNVQSRNTQQLVRGNDFQHTNESNSFEDNQKTKLPSSAISFSSEPDELNKEKKEAIQKVEEVVVPVSPKYDIAKSENINQQKSLLAPNLEGDKKTLYGDSQEPVSSQTGKGSVVSLGGGMNYGSLNAGYTLGLSARRSIGKHFFVEGSVAFLYNNQAPNTSNYPGPPTMPSRPSSFAPNNLQAPSMKLVSDFYYVQVNPSFGYQVNRLLALSAGVDLQQRIANMSQNGTAVFAPSTDPQIIPQLDFGVTGKTEFFISPKVEAGVLYRNGLNNLVQPKDVHPFLNRRYIQVQLKYNFLLGK